MAPGRAFREAGISHRLPAFHRLAAAACLLLAALLPWAAAAQPPAAITVVLDDNYPPYIFRAADGSLQGILKDTWDLWSAKTGIRVNLRAMDWGRVQGVMRAGEADVIDTIFETPERQRHYDFSTPYATIDVPIYFHSSISGIAGVETLRGFFVGVKDGDACADWLVERGVTTLVRYPSYETMVEAAGRHELRVFCIDQPPASYFFYKKGLESQFRRTDPLYSGQFHWAVLKGEQRLFRMVEDGFSRITKDERDTILSRWMGADLNRPDWRYVGQITLALEVAAGGALLLAVWAWILRRQVASRTRQMKAALEALRSSELHYRELVSLTPVGVFETDAAGKCVFVNERWSKITGIAAEHALGDGGMRALHPDDHERVHHEWEAAARNRVMFQSEYRFVAKGGAETWVLGQARAKKDAAGAVSGYIGTITDISAAKTAEAALAASEARFRAIFDAITDAIFIHDAASGELLAVNRRMLDMYGYDEAAEVLGAAPGQFSEGAPPYDQAHARQWIARAAAGQPQVFEWRAKAKGGRVFWVEVNIHRARIAGAERLLVVVRDISERKQSEQELTRRSDELERSNSELEQFAYVASHDLREPLRMVSSYMALLERRYGDRLDRDGLEFIAFAKEGAVRMDQLVQDLLEFSRVGRLADPFAPEPLGEVVARVLRMLGTVIAEKGVRVEIPEPLPTLTCSANEIFLLFQNLISNAIKFQTPDHPPVVTVTARRRPAGWEISVADNGIGIDPAYQERIFKIFHRLHTRDKYDGTGIGLSICKKIVEHHGGRIWVDSELGQGAVFRFVLADKPSP